MRLSEFESILTRLISSRTPISIMMWGAPGIGKSSVVRKVASALNLELTDVRLSQLAPTDLRGLPLISSANLSSPNSDEVMKWAVPNFLPRDPNSRGILFLDEFNMASGSMMGIAQQLILDRKVGDYTLPPNWVIIAAGNRASDRAAISVMPAPVSNRFIHYHLDSHLDDFKTVAYDTFLKNGITSETIGKVLGFLNFKPDLLNTSKISQGDLQFPTPRSWENAMRLLDLGLDTEAAIGEATSVQFRAYLRIYASLPNIDKVINGGGDKVTVTKKQSSDPSVVYAIISSLISKSETLPHYINSLSWILDHSPEVFTQDYIGLFISESITKVKADPTLSLPDYIQSLVTNSRTKEFISTYRELITNFGKA